MGKAIFVLALSGKRRPMFVRHKPIHSLLLILLVASCATEEYDSSKPVAGQITPTITSARTDRITRTRTPGCTVISRQPTLDPSEISLIPPPTNKDWSQGPGDAYVTIIEYGDFQCPGSASMAPVLAALLSDHLNDVRIVYRHFPLTMHDKAALATQATEAAGLQGKFWELYNLLFVNRSEWVDLTKEEFLSWLDQNVDELALDRGRFFADINSDALVSLAKEAYTKNAAIGMSGTPFLVINGIPYNGPLDYANLAATVEMILLEKRQFTDCPPMIIDPKKQYIATLHTEKGNIEIELYADKAPLAVNSFVFLASQGWFDRVTFHRVIEGYIAQAGDPSGTGFGGPGYAFSNEISPDLTFDGPGVVGMANAGPDSNGSQFFITYTATPRLNGGYTIFGRVISGMDVVERLTVRDPSQSMELPPGDLILGVTIEEK
jgi:cyclophilin family peptidyl-prolyl cis-trans isomerase/protein-disulfide isomerase